MASVLQVAELINPLPASAPVDEVLWIAGELIAEASRTGRLSRDFLISWLGDNTNEEGRQALLRRLMDPSYRFNVPVLAASVRGWWLQITRRLIWVTNDTVDEGRLLELLIRTHEIGTSKPPPLVAAEAVLIAVPMTRQPADWAFSARIWPAGSGRPVDRPWSMLAKAIHGHGIPTITLDRASTHAEIACQVVLKGYWHGYIGNDARGLAAAVAMAFPKQVERVRRQTDSPTTQAAAATLLEGLVRPGFDHARGAESIRRYVSRKASIAVMEHRKRDAPDLYPWTRIGISERRYYKLLPRFARKVGGRFHADQDEIIVEMREYLDTKERLDSIRAAAMQLLQERGFTKVAARKWLQRHPAHEAIKAWPRETRRQATAFSTPHASRHSSDH